jgi:hypothetical protein
MKPHRLRGVPLTPHPTFARFSRVALRGLRSIPLKFDESRWMMEVDPVPAGVLLKTLFEFGGFGAA